MHRLIMVVMALWFGISWGKNTHIKQIYDSKMVIKNHKNQRANVNIMENLPVLSPMQIETQHVIHGFEKQKEKFSTDTKGGIKTLDNNVVMP